MNRIDTIIDALEKAKDGWQCFDEFEKALAAARELKADALKVIEAQSKQSNEFYPDWDMIKPLHERIKELEAQLAKTEQEPNFCKDCGHGLLGKDHIHTCSPQVKRQWVGLTDDEIKEILDCGRGGFVDIKKAEQILKEKNT